MHLHSLHNTWFGARQRSRPLAGPLVPRSLLDVGHPGQQRLIRDDGAVRRTGCVAPGCPVDHNCLSVRVHLVHSDAKIGERDAVQRDADLDSLRTANKVRDQAIVVYVVGAEQPASDLRSGGGRVQMLRGDYRGILGAPDTP